ncbi:UNVERIFIED_CONTAM: hypothetical protein PYX00_004834 [Menopon gallinae]|uniref:Uroporphyrinogen-III synthase n=1 Tax=Menopon gallinae TaxID=328185 RepID=A0AAW2I6X5_9NEOP
MSNVLGQVVIFKAPTDSDKEQKDAYREVLSSGGFDVINVPVLDFEFINLEVLSVKLNQPEDYSGIIFSSPRCVKACELACDNRTDSQVVPEKWKRCQNFAVGETTAKTAEEVGFQVSGKEAGNANALADVITKGDFDKPFLYPIGSLTNDNFRLKLKESNIDVEDIVVYKTKPYPNLEDIVTKLLDRLVQPVYFLYFSPSGVKFTIPILRGKNFNEDSVKVSMMLILDHIPWKS